MSITPEQMRTLAAAAIEAAAAAPRRKNKWAVAATVPWALIQRIRDTCDEVGIDWRALQKPAAPEQTDPL